MGPGVYPRVYVKRRNVVVKFSSSVNGKPVVGLGLSETNINKLREGMPILISTEDMKKLLGVECSIMIMYGRTEKEITKTLEPLITPETDIIT
jgi:hypothetical protein